MYPFCSNYSSFRAPLVDILKYKDSEAIVRHWYKVRNVPLCRSQDEFSWSHILVATYTTQQIS